jgi:hypothetical protein
MEGAPPVANQIDLFMHFLGASRDGLVARPGEMDKLSSTLNRLISVRWRLVLEPIVTQNTKCHLKVQLVLEFPLSLFCIVKVLFH